MWTYFAAACAVFLFAQAFVWGGQIYDQSADQAGTARGKSVEERIAQVMAGQNKQRGQKVDGAVFAGASQSGKTIVFEFTLDLAPARYDAVQAHDRLLSQMIPRFCRPRFYPDMREGAAVVFRYVTKSGLSLVDAKVDAGVCQVPV